jgi:hypothetical protein
VDREGGRAERVRACPPKRGARRRETSGVNSRPLSSPYDDASERRAKNMCGFGDLRRRSDAYAFGLDLDDVPRACYDEPPGAGG